MFRKKMTDHELRLECAKLSVQIYRQFYIETADRIYDYVTSQSKESKATQKKPHECFFCRLCSKIRGRLK